VETLSEPGGVIVVGWVGDAVLWAKFTGVLSASLGGSYALKLERYLKSCPRLRYFVDASSMDSYDLLARSATTRVIMAHRQRIRSMLVLMWSGDVSASSRALMVALDDTVEMTTSAELFDSKLTEAAPLARQKIDPRRWAKLSERASASR
jgi:hypothetical protein